MILCFPDLDRLLLALTSRAVPPEVAQKPAVAGFGEDEQIWVETTAKLPTAAQRELKQLGVRVCKASEAEFCTEVSCWLELVPLERDEVAHDALEKTPVLFDVPSNEELARLVLEMLRLGNDRQSYCWLEETSNGDIGRGLLRVVGPPYYSLLRALDQIGGPGVAPLAFVERAPGVWVEVGSRHPLAASIKPPKGKILLLRPTRQWLLLPDAPFRDIYEIVEFAIADGSTRWQDHSLPHRLRVAPRLRQAGPAEGAELWVLRGEAIDELNRFVQNAEDPLLARLAFAVGAKNGQTIVVLRVRQSKQPPPVLVLPAEEYKSHLKLPNLFLPVGHTLQPPLRRDVVRKLLADDPAQITWLVPAASGGSETPGSFIPEGLADDVFRPLTDWVDYVLDRDREPLQAWVQAMQFEFEPFICDEDQPSKPKKPPVSDKTRGPKGASGRAAGEADKRETTAYENAAASAAQDPLLEAFAAIEKAEPSAIEKELRAVEEAFLALPGGMDDPSHRDLWPRLADLNARLTKWSDAGICWLNALWDAHELSGKWTAAWFRTEALGALHRHANPSRQAQPWIAGAATVQGIRRDVNGDDLDDLLSLPEPGTADLRTLAAYLAWAARREPRPADLVQRLPALQRFLEKHEHLLPVRACWLAWYHLVQLTDGDVLALARARDRLLERLFHNGLRPEQDLPAFLRFAGNPAGQRYREVREWMKRLYEKARLWLEDNRDILDRKPPTKAYADLLFAFGMARLGENDEAKRLLHRARGVLHGDSRIHRFLLTAFMGRIQTVLDGKPHTGPLPQALLDELEGMPMLDRYVIERVRDNSRIFEPDRKIDAYRHWTSKVSLLDKELIELTDLPDRAEIQSRILALLQKTVKGQAGDEDRAKIVHAGLELGPHVGEELALRMLDQALPTLNALPAPTDEMALEQRAKFLEKALFTAAHFGSSQHVRPLVARFRLLLQARREQQAIDAIARLVDQSFRSLRKLGMREEIDSLLQELADLILRGKSIEVMVRSFDARKDALAPLLALLHVAGCWYFFGRDELAEPVVKAARGILFNAQLTQPKQQRDLACAYARTVGQAPPEIALARLEEIFTHLKNYRDTFTTSGYFSVVQLDLIEAVVLSVVSDDFTQGSQVRRWLDEDEYLVRQRIHTDVRNLMAKA